MLKPGVWASFGTGLVLTAAGLVFNVAALLLLAALCYAIALMGYLRNKRRLAKKPQKGGQPETYTGPTTGILMEDCSDNTFVGTPRIHGFDTALRMKNSDRNEFEGGIEATAPKRPKRKSGDEDETEDRD